MPNKKQPVSLQKLALNALDDYIVEVGRSMIEPVVAASKVNVASGIKLLHQGLSNFNRTLYGSVPWYLYDSVAHLALTAIKKFIQETRDTYCNYEPMSSFMQRMNVVVNLTEIAIHPQLKHINFSMWPKIMRHVLYRNLYKMNGLETLDLGSGSGGWNTSDIEKWIVSGVTSMSNLASLCLCFDCTDHILMVVSQNCHNLQKLDVTASRSVTDRSVSGLLNCWRLTEIRLNRTSISIEGYSSLLAGLRHLVDVGRCDEFGYILEHIHATYNTIKLYSLKSFQSRDINTCHLNLLIEMCPNITHVAIYHDEAISDLTVLASLENLTELKLMSCDFYTHHVKSLLEFRGYNLTWLHLEHVDEIDINALIYISQFCPNLKKLVFYNCEFLDHTSLTMRRFVIPPFQNLEHMMCVAECSLSHLEFLLSKCFKIKFIHLGSSTGISDTTMNNILLQNPMKQLEELKILYSEHLSMRTVNLLMSQCPKLRVLSELEGWQGISATDLDQFRQKLRDNNVDLDIRPTLSFYG